MKRYSILIAVLCSLVAATSFAAPKSAKALKASKKHSKSRTSSLTDTSGQSIQEIVVQGNRNIEADSIKSNISSTVGNSYSSERVRQDIGQIFKMGFFQDIQVSKNSVAGGVQLVYKVEEKPPITAITFEGNSDLSEDDLRDAAGIKAYSIMSMGQIRTAMDKMQKLYEDKGFFLAKISYQLIPQNGAVKLQFDIEENDKVSVKRITLVGNKNLSSDTLKSRLQTREGGFFSFFSGSGAFKQDAFERDIQIIYHSYLNEGFIEVKVDQPQVYVSPDKRSIYITYRIEEGPQFRVGKVDFSGDILFPYSELKEAIQIDKKEIFSYMTLQNDISNLSAKYGDLGYAFANVVPQTKPNEGDKTVDITFDFDKGQKAYFGTINITGNDRTRDKVIRREMKIAEGELYNETRKRESIANIQRLGYFEANGGVNLKTSTPPDQPTILNLEIQVKEKNTGSLQVGAGYSSYQKFVLQGSVNEANLFGKGQSLAFSVNYSSKEQLFSLNFTEPHFMDTDWSTGIELFRRSENRPDYDQTRTGAALRVGHPIGDRWSVFMRYRIDNTNIELDPEEGDPDLFPVDTVNGITSSIQPSIEYDSRDDRLQPRNGQYASLSYEFAGLGGDKRYSKTGITYRYYKNIFWDVIWKNNLNYGRLDSLQAGKDVPFNELYLLGGAYTLRGFRYFDVGTRKYSIAKGEERPFGGTQQFYYNLEFEFPLVDEAKISGVVFFDAGNAENSIQFDDLRADYGFGFRWFTPFGPLRFEWGFPINRREELNEAPFNFEFSIGTPF